MVQCLIRIEEQDLARMDQAAERGKLTRSAWIRSVLRQAADRHLAYRELPPLRLDPLASQVIIVEDEK